MPKDERLQFGNSFNQVIIPQADAAALDVENATNFDETNPNHKAKFATLVHVVGGTVSGGGSTPAASGTTGGTLINPILIPGAGDPITVSDTTMLLSSEILLDADTTLVRIAIIGQGDLMVTYNGDNPSDTMGEPRYPGGVLEVSKHIASQLKMKRKGTADCNIYVTQFSI